MTERCVIRDHGISDPEFDSPLPVFLLYKGNGPRMERPRSPRELRKSLRQVGRAQGEVRKPKCQRKED